MPSIEIRHVDGTSSMRTLSRTQPLLIGRQSFNDICVPDDDVGPMHCRILWNKNSFEVAAGTSNGVEVNGTSVTHSRLNAGDVVRVGSVDLVYSDGEEDSDREEMTLKLREDSPPTPAPLPRKEPRKESPRFVDDEDDVPHRLAELDEPLPNRAERNQKSPTKEPKPIEDMSLFEGPINTQSQVLAAFADEDWAADDKNISNVTLKPLGGSRSSDRSSGSSRPEKSDRKKDSPILTLPSRARPGEQDIFQSPLVLGLSGGGIVLLLVAGIFWFLIGREQAARLYDRAVSELNSGQYAQSITSFEQFLAKYSGHSLHKSAERGLARALVQKEIAGATPAWKVGLEQLQALITSQRNEPDFKDLHPTIHKYAEEISLGAARTAETTRDAGLLTISEDAQVVFERYADPSSPPSAALLRIKEARTAAIIAVGKQKMFDDSMAIIDQALAAGKPMAALSERERLVRSFEGFASQKRVKEALQKALDLERSVITTDDTERAAETTEISQAGLSSVLALFHTRTRTDDTAQGRVVFAMAKDCCYAIETVTGELIWKRVIGFNAPFFPMTVSGKQPGLLIYDAPAQSLLCCRPTTGALIWRQKLNARPLSAPLVSEGQIYIATDDRSLCRIDLETGRLTERAIFSQNVVGPPVITYDGNHLLIPGEMAMIYALSMRPLTAVATTFTDHGEGSISAPPMALGKLLLLCDNDKLNSSLLRQWDAGMPKNPLVELTAKAFRVRGQVRQSPVLRGNQLVVPSSGEQLAAFTVTDDPGREGLVPIAQYRISADETTSDTQPEGKGDRAVAEAGEEKDRQTKSNVPVYVALGADQLFWVASTAFRRFDIGPDAIRIHPSLLAVGVASQELQLAGDQFFMGRKISFHDAVVFTAIDRDRMVSPWRTVLGSKFLELIPGRDGGAVGITEAGHLIVMGVNRLRQGGFDLKGATELELPAEIKQPLIASKLREGQIFLAAQGDVAQIWIFNSAGQIEFSSKLAAGEEVKSGAVLLDGGLVVPLSGRLKFVPTRSGGKPVQDWMAPAGDQPAPDWRFLVPLDEDEFIACDGVLLSRIQLRMDGVPHLTGVAKLQLGQPVDIPPAFRDDLLLLADASGTVELLNMRSFDREGIRQFKSPVRGVWSVGDSWMVWSGDEKLSLVSQDRNLTDRWSFDLNDLKPAGQPVEVDRRIWIACRDGQIVSLDTATGTELNRVVLPQALTMGLKKLDDTLYAVASDGTLYRIQDAEGAK